MSFPPDDEYGDLLRRALRAEADSVVPSPEGLEIIRRRVEKRRGMRGVLWWRIGASLAGAVLVAGTVVMLVPDLRQQVTDSTGIFQVNVDRKQERDTSSITRPPAPPQVIPVVPTPSVTRPHPSPSPTHRTSATSKPAPQKPDPCASPPAGVVEPDPPPVTCATAPATVPAPVTPTVTAAPSSAPPTPAPTPTPVPTPTPAETPATDVAATPTS